MKQLLREAEYDVKNSAIRLRRMLFTEAEVRGGKQLPQQNSSHALGGGLLSPLYNFKTAHDAATKITQNDVLIISNIYL